MRRTDQHGASPLLLPLIATIVLLLGSAVFAVWSYQGRQDFKTKVDQKVSVAVRAARKQQNDVDQATYLELEKQPLTSYHGPEAYGSIIVSYPKTWSGYVDDSSQAGNGVVVNGYFYPGTVPSISAQSSIFALRLEVLSQGYSQVLPGLTAQQQSPPKVSAYSLPKVPSVIGVRLDGLIAPGKTGSMIVLPLRDKTLEVWTESPQFENDFNQNILQNLTFSP